MARGLLGVTFSMYKSWFLHIFALEIKVFEFLCIYAMLYAHTFGFPSVLVPGPSHTFDSPSVLVRPGILIYLIWILRSLRDANFDSVDLWEIAYGNRMEIAYGNRVWKSSMEIIYRHEFRKFRFSGSLRNRVRKSRMEIIYWRKFRKFRFSGSFGHRIWKS